MNKKIEKLFGWVLLTITTFFYIGRIGKNGKGGGTATSTAVSLILISCRFYGIDISLITILGISILGFILGTCIAERAEAFMVNLGWPQKRHNKKKKVKGDFNQTTLDEVIGMLITVLPIYAAEAWFNVNFTIGQFIVLQLIALIWFRALDILKLWPISKLEEKTDTTSGLIIMLDDVLAGCMAIPIMIVSTYLLLNF